MKNACLVDRRFVASGNHFDRFYANSTEKIASRCLQDRRKARACKAVQGMFPLYTSFLKVNSYLMHGVIVTSIIVIIIVIVYSYGLSYGP